MRRIARVAIPLLLLAGAAYGGARIYRAEKRESVVQAVQGRVMKLVQPRAEEREFVPTTAVRQGKFGVSLTVVGTLKATESTPVSAETQGTLIWLVEDGAPVKKGDVLAQLQSDQLVRQIDDKHVEYVNALQKLEDTKRDRKLEAENARTQLGKAEQELNILVEQNTSAVAQAEAALEFQRTDLALARAQLGKQQRLAEERLVPRTQVDSAQQEVDAKQFAVAKAEADLVLKKNQLASDENQKKAEVQRARFAVEVSQKRIGEETESAQKNAEMLKKQEDDFREQLAKTIIRAPSNGVVVLEQRWDGGLRTMRAGDTVSPQRKILELPNLQTMTAVCEIEEKDIGAVQRGLPVRITLDPFPGALFHGVVSNVATVAKQASVEGSGMEASKSTFTTTIAIRESDPHRLRPGMNATLQIIGRSLENVIHVPVDALFTWKGKPVLYVERGDSYVRTPVRTGARNRDYVVLSNEKKRPCPVRPGQRVALVEPG
jgi:multidrug efflux pump subunit AcrA (membrane-fusion protein)